MADTKDYTLCVTCHTELPPGTETHYFTQSALFPHKADLSFEDELIMLINSMQELFNAIANGKNEDEEIDEALARLGYEVAQEARRRLSLLQEAQGILWKRWYTLRQRLGEEEVA